jgi:hypothetical protein
MTDWKTLGKNAAKLDMMTFLFHSLFILWLNVLGEVDGVRMVELLVPNQVGQSFLSFFQP